MYAMLMIIFLIAAMISASQGNLNMLVGLSIVSGLFGIASCLSAIYTYMTDKLEKIVKLDIEKVQK